MTSTIIFSNLFCTGKIIFFRWIRPHLITSQRKLNWQNFFSSLPTLLPPSQASNGLSPYGSPRWPSTKDVCNYKPYISFFTIIMRYKNNSSCACEKFDLLLFFSWLWQPEPPPSFLYTHQKVEVFAWGID